MADEYADPSGNTEAFRAFAHSADPPAQEPANRLPLLIAGAALAVLLLVLLGWLVLA